MTQRTVASVCICVMIPVGIVAGAFFLYFLPHITDLFASTGKALPVYLRVLVNIGQYGWFFSTCYIALFIALICWFYTAKPLPKNA